MRVDAFIRHRVSWAGCSEHLFTDSGTQFTSTLWKDMCGYLGCQLQHSTAYHPQVQCLLERLNRTLKSSLKYYENPSEWYNQLSWVILALRNSPKEDLAHQSTNFFVFVQSTRLPGEFFETTVSDFQDPTPDFAHRLAQHFSILT